MRLIFDPIHVAKPEATTRIRNGFVRSVPEQLLHSGRLVFEFLICVVER